MNNYEVKERLVKSGKSRVFQNWHTYAGITEEEFLEGLKWVCEDLMPNGYLTRELGCEIPGGAEKGRGKIVKLVRAYRTAVNGWHDFQGFYRLEGEMLHPVWNGRVSISARDRV